ncbi:MAG: alpha/beta hydrolase [Akkermansiaceae bacterium]
MPRFMMSPGIRYDHMTMVYNVSRLPVLLGMVLGCLVFTEVNAGNSPLVPDKKVTYKLDPKFPDQPLTLDIFYPDDFKQGQKRPAIVFFFGGGWVGGKPSQFYAQAAYMASRGMVAISASYRTKKSHKVEPSGCVEDGKSAIRYIRKHAAELGIDPDQLAVGGGSAGGHVAAATATAVGFDHPDDDVTISTVGNALVLFNPVYDNGPGAYGHDRVKEYWRQISPMHNLGKKVPPTIVFLGAEDSLIPVTTAMKYQRLMEEQGNRCETFIYEGQKHGFFNLWTLSANSEYFVKTMIETDRFLASLDFLSGKPSVEAWLDKAAE